MKIGYACINTSLDCRSSRTFRLKNYSQERLIETVKGNLECLQKILRYNVAHQILFFRITSDLIPFASHSVMDYDWQEHFRSTFHEIGSYIRQNNMRITMHPGQYTVLNSKSQRVYENSLRELKYHVQVLDLLGLDKTAKVQTHVGGVYGQKKQSKARFIERYKGLSEEIKDRYMIENDEKSYNLQDCLDIHAETNAPIVLDVYHHECKNQGESLPQAFNLFQKTWNKDDGLPIIHYSSMKKGGNPGNHALTIDMEHFEQFLEQTQAFNFDMMMEIKDKEQSAQKGIEHLKDDPRLNNDNHSFL